MNKVKKSGLPRYTLEDISLHCDQHSCWIIVSDMVYDVTPFIREHPGGDDIILEHAGRDATMAFLDKGHSVDAMEMLSNYLIGELRQGEREYSNRAIGST